jgi:hypothetical protein
VLSHHPHDGSARQEAHDDAMHPGAANVNDEHNNSNKHTNNVIFFLFEVGLSMHSRENRQPLPTTKFFCRHWFKKTKKSLPPIFPQDTSLPNGIQLHNHSDTNDTEPCTDQQSCFVLFFFFFF